MLDLAIVAEISALAYGSALSYTVGAKVWSFFDQKPEAKAIKSFVDKKHPELFRLPTHAHSNTGWEQSTNHIHISCAAADKEEVHSLDPDARIGKHLCADCKEEVHKYSLDVAEWTVHYNQNNVPTPKEDHPDYKNPWLWPLWVALKPFDLLTKRIGNGCRG